VLTSDDPVEEVLTEDVVVCELEDEVVDETVVSDWDDWLVVALELAAGVATK